jgi:uridine kinase
METVRSGDSAEPLDPLNEMTIKPLVIISGPIGAGKTTVARELVAASPPPVTYIEGDKFWFFIAKGEGHVPRDFKMIMTAMTAAALP